MDKSYIEVPIASLKTNRLSLSEQIIFHFIRGFNERGEDFDLTNKQIEKVLFTSNSTVQRSVNRLINNGLISSSSGSGVRVLYASVENLQKLCNDEKGGHFE